MNLTVTAEVAGSSPVVPAINPKKIKALWRVAKSRSSFELAESFKNHRHDPIIRLAFRRGDCSRVHIERDP